MTPERYRSLSYNLRNGPQKENFYERIWEEGINCQGLLHLVYNDIFGIHLPSYLRSKEIFEDEIFFRNVSRESQPIIGDVYLFGRENLQDMRKLHIAVVCNINPNILLIHATPLVSGVAVWQLEKFFSYERYKVLYGIKRWKNMGDNLINS
ncbi:MAG: hypothetical protein N3A54_05095 [Patescibacteria group bacterium]|nr:hypothetical protein [Patescibacteria group bacterium]